MGRRVSRLNIYRPTSHSTREATYVYLVLGESPTRALVNAEPAFPENAAIGTYLWTFVDDLDAGASETEHVHARVFGIQLVDVNVDYLSPAHHNDSIVSLTFASSPKVGLTDMDIPAVQWRGQVGTQSETRYHDLNGVLVPDGMSVLVPSKRMNATIEGWGVTVAMEEFVGMTNESMFRYNEPGTVLYMGYDEDLIHGTASDEGPGKANIVLEFVDRKSVV